MKKYILSFIFLLGSCATHLEHDRSPASLPQTSWQQFLDEEVFNHRPLSEFFPDAEHLKGWKNSSEIAYANTPILPNQLKVTSVKCDDKKLWPTSPQESTKDYLFGVNANYNYPKLPPKSEACLISNPTKKYCLSSTYANVFIMSDFYRDSCGNYYRGFWLVTFLKKDDNMGTLLSKGRTVYPKPNAQFPGEYVTGYTYPVESDSFLVLSVPTAGDMKLIERDRTYALTHGYKMNGLSFEPVK